MRYIKQQCEYSERRICRALGISRSAVRYEPQPRLDEPALTSAIVGLAAQYGRYGYRRVPALLASQGWQVSHGRVMRIWRREGPEGSGETTQAAQALAQRRLMHPAAT